MKRLLNRYWSVSVERKFQDLWIGIYWRADDLTIDVWICFVPCFPLHITIARWELA
jgi:hypothetical protein